MQSMTENLHNRLPGKDGVFAQDVVRILCKALETSTALGIGRKAVARRLGVASSLIDRWCAPSHPTAITSADLLALIVRDDVFPDEARAVLVREIGHMGGFVMRSDIDADHQPATAQVVEICKALGDVSRVVSDSARDSSRGGAEISGAEARELTEALDELTKQADQLKAALADKHATRRRV